MLELMSVLDQPIMYISRDSQTYPQTFRLGKVHAHRADLDSRNIREFEIQGDADSSRFIVALGAGLVYAETEVSVVTKPGGGSVDLLIPKIHEDLVDGRFVGGDLTSELG